MRDLSPPIPNSASPEYAESTDEEHPYPSPTTTGNPPFADPIDPTIGMQEKYDSYTLRLRKNHVYFLV
jgi:hypothetical protein